MRTTAPIPCSARRASVLPPTARRLRLLDAEDAPRRLLRYRTETIDFSREHGDGLRRVTTEGVIEDGSGERDYAYGTSCKWLFVAPPGHRVELDFLEMDTEGRVDVVHLFDGEHTLPERLMAMFSGHERPPRLTSRGEGVLVWFVSDRERQFGGWRARARVRFVRPAR